MFEIDRQSNHIAIDQNDRADLSSICQSYDKYETRLNKFDISRSFETYARDSHSKLIQKQ